MCYRLNVSTYYYNVRRASRIVERIHLTRSAHVAQNRCEPGRDRRFLGYMSARNSLPGLDLSRARIFRRREDVSATLSCPPSPLFISSAVITANCGSPRLPYPRVPRPGNVPPPTHPPSRMSRVYHIACVT